MENSNFLKIIILVLAGLTIWNTFRIETVIEGGKASETESSDTLIISEVATDSSVESQVARLTKQVNDMQKTINSQQSKIDRLTRQTKSNPSSGSSGRSSTATTKITPPKVEAKVRVENRYVQGTTHLPESKSGIAGTVVIEVKLNQLGMVGSAKVTSGTTITDEDVRYNCKEAALKTNFAYNPEAPDTSTGTITYTFN